MDVTDSGATWTEDEGDSSQKWTCVTCSANGEKCVAGVGRVGGPNAGQDKGNLWYSPDFGRSWLNATSGEPALWRAVSCSNDGQKCVAVQSSSIWTSTNSGVTWTKSEIAGDHTWKGVSCSGDAVKCVATNDKKGIWRSVDSGVNWSLLAGTPGDDDRWRDVSCSDDGSK